MEGQVFQFAADLAHAQPVGDGRVDVQGFARDLLLPLLREILQGAHVVQAVGQLDEHHADVVHHGQHHLAHVLGLRLFGGSEIDFADLGDALDDVGHLLAELRLDLVHGHGGVFHGVVQQPGDDGGGVQPHVRQHDGDFQGMHQVGFARLAHLSFVMLFGEFVGLLHQGLVFGGAVGADFAQKIAKAGNGENVGRDVLAQCRHVRLYDGIAAYPFFNKCGGMFTTESTERSGFAVFFSVPSALKNCDGYGAGKRVSSNENIHACAH